MQSHYDNTYHKDITLSMHFSQCAITDKERPMAKESPTRVKTTILILGTVQSENQDFFSALNSFSLLMIKGKDEETILNIPAWPVIVAIFVFFVVRAIRSK
jgi:hypothetical protein